MGEERAELLWTDPPYGVSYEGKTAEALTIQGDGARGLEALLSESFSAADSALASGARLYVAHPAGELSLTFGGCFVGQGQDGPFLRYSGGTVIPQGKELQAFLNTFPGVDRQEGREARHPRSEAFRRVTGYPLVGDPRG